VVDAAGRARSTGETGAPHSSGGVEQQHRRDSPWRFIAFGSEAEIVRRFGKKPRIVDRVWQQVPELRMDPTLTDSANFDMLC
jgi:hypothetical protein